MRIFVGIVLGLISGFMIYMAAAMLFTSGDPSMTFVFVTFFGGWALSSWIMIRKAQTVSKVFSRAFLIGAAEWLTMIPAGVVLSGRLLVETTEGVDDGAALVGATIGAGLVSFLTGGVAIGMAIACLIGFVISYLINREMKPEAATPTRTCPECAELIQAAARRCKHCGAEI